jgi:hypothetical protein
MKRLCLAGSLRAQLLVAMVVPQVLLILEERHVVHLSFMGIFSGTLLILVRRRLSRR